MNTRTQYLVKLEQLKITPPWWSLQGLRTTHKTNEDDIKTKLKKLIILFIDDTGKVKQPSYFYSALQITYEYELIFGTHQAHYLNYIQQLQKELYQCIINDVVIRSHVIMKLNQKDINTNISTRLLDNIMLMLIDLHRQSVLASKALKQHHKLKLQQYKPIDTLPDQLLQYLQQSPCLRLKTMATILAMRHCRNSK